MCVCFFFFFFFFLKKLNNLSPRFIISLLFIYFLFIYLFIFNYYYYYYYYYFSFLLVDMVYVGHSVTSRKQGVTFLGAELIGYISLSSPPPFLPLPHSLLLSNKELRSKNCRKL